MSELEATKFAARLNEVCDDMLLPEKFTGRQVELAKVISTLTEESLSSKAARKWLEGQGFPSTDKIILIAKWADVSAEWLISGRGTKKYIDVDMLDPRMAHVLKIMQELPDYKIDQAVKIVDTIAEPAPDSNHKSA